MPKNKASTMETTAAAIISVKSIIAGGGFNHSRGFESTGVARGV